MVTPVAPAPRVGDLNGKRVGLYWNIKSGGDVALERSAERIKALYPSALFSEYQGDVGAGMRHITGRYADRIVKEVDVIIGTTSD